MKFTLSWLKEYLDTTASVEQLTDALIQLGLEVENIENPSQSLAEFKVAYVKDVRVHPNADRLRICQVETKEGEVKVVCGAANVAAGQKIIFAPVGATIPSTGVVLKKAAIRGEESCGMICSFQELKMNEEGSSQGIAVLSEDAPIGMPIAEYLEMDDPIFEIFVTPNRADCFGIYYIARDLAAKGMGELKPLPDLSLGEVTGRSPIHLSLDLSESDKMACSHFAGRYIQGVRNGPSPAWLKKRLKAVGVRSISAIVDITNYVMFSLNRPLHAFDADRISGQDVRVHTAEKGQKFFALDQKEYELDAMMTLVSDREKPLALAGIIGGQSSECCPSTVNVFLESAFFDPERTTLTGRKLGILTESRTRFERGVDPNMVRYGLDFATKLILDICGGKASEVIEVRKQEEKKEKILVLRRQRLIQVIGKDIPQAKNYLNKLGFKIDEKASSWQSGVQSLTKDILTLIVPSWRVDIHQEVDIIEEVIRLEGYDGLPLEPLPLQEDVLRRQALSKEKSFATSELQIKKILCTQGLTEAYTWSFISPEMAELFSSKRDDLTLVNPISQDLSVMRPSIIPGLLLAAKKNHARGQSNVNLFELGTVFFGTSLEEQPRVVTALRAGVKHDPHWSSKPSAVTVFDIKTDLGAVLKRYGLDINRMTLSKEGVPKWYHPGRSVTVKLGKNILGYFGEIHPKVLKGYDFEKTVVAFELFIERLPQKKQSLSKGPFVATNLMMVTRDFSFIVDRAVPAQTVLQTAENVDKALIVKAVIFDIFEDGALGSQRKSLTLRLWLQPKVKSFTHEEIDLIANKIISSVITKTGGELRA